MESLQERLADSMNQYDTLRVSSWTLEDYYGAVDHDDVFEAVAENLDASLDTGLLDKIKISRKIHDITLRQRLVEAKYHYAGGCCRGMFDYSTSNVILELRHAVESVQDPEAYFKALIGTYSPNVKNILLGRTNSSQTVLISDYAGYLLAMKMEVGVLENFFFNNSQLKGNPSVEGSFFEAKFFTLIQNSRDQQIKLYKKNENIQWDGGHVHPFDPGAPTLPSDKVWLKPIKFNQGGYDGLFVDKNTRLVRFIQLTIQQQHTFKYEFYNQAIKKLSDCLENSELKVEVYFVVPEKRIGEFRVPQNGHLQGCGAGANNATRTGGGRTDCVCKEWVHVVGMEWEKR